MPLRHGVQVSGRHLGTWVWTHMKMGEKVGRERALRCTHGVRLRKGLCLARLRRSEQRGRRPRSMGVGKEGKGRVSGKWGKHVGDALRSQTG